MRQLNLAGADLRAPDAFRWLCPHGQERGAGWTRPHVSPNRMRPCGNSSMGDCQGCKKYGTTGVGDAAVHSRAQATGCTLHWCRIRASLRLDVRSPKDEHHHRSNAGRRHASDEGVRHLSGDAPGEQLCDGERRRCRRAGVACAVALAPTSARRRDRRSGSEKLAALADCFNTHGGRVAVGASTSTTAGTALRAAAVIPSTTSYI
jgi:hypothetical protein